MFLASAPNKNAVLLTFIYKTIQIHVSGYGPFPNVQRDCYPFGLKRSQLGPDTLRMHWKFYFSSVLVEIRL